MQGTRRLHHTLGVEYLDRRQRALAGQLQIGGIVRRHDQPRYVSGDVGDHGYEPADERQAHGVAHRRVALGHGHGHRPGQELRCDDAHTESFRGARELEIDEHAFHGDLARLGIHAVDNRLAAGAGVDDAIEQGEPALLEQADEGGGGSGGDRLTIDGAALDVGLHVQSGEDGRQAGPGLGLLLAHPGHERLPAQGGPVEPDLGQLPFGGVLAGQVAGQAQWHPLGLLAPGPCPPAQCVDRDEDGQLGDRHRSRKAHGAVQDAVGLGHGPRSIGFPFAADPRALPQLQDDLPGRVAVAGRRREVEGLLAGGVGQALDVGTGLLGQSLDVRLGRVAQLRRPFHRHPGRLLDLGPGRL